ncbi:GTP-binding protein [Vibrio mediterranei]|uniref:CobW family GTP-binding protein n=1 Tax=Vibrio mediterranei TaxID=689 RepID=UPI001EFD80EE|nr:GTP-binding protein [Vibrio mediterranei]MCG9659400.1 GTP-binding protein [Vibrio mediterranei]MCG9663824.1 GTP-binding protein [Vibrio mediterranei]
MNSDNQPITGVPTNIITGFLGVGKTSAILSLMKNKPKNERWAILVNEFGEIGIDGSLVQGQHNDKQQVFIREVPGGCMCCAAGLPMQIALNQLLSEARPDRLLIEPTGLGHPKEVLEVLSTEHYRQVLSLQKTITLVDARRLSDSRYTQHDTFNQQISIADTIVGNKFDLYQPGDSEKLTTYVAKVGQPNTKVVFAEHGAIPLSEFEGETSIHQHPPHHHHHHSQSKPLVSEQDLPESGFLKAENEGEGFQSVGWRFSPDKVFNRQKLILLLVELDVERMKAVFITEDGIFGYNLTSDGLTEVVLDDYFESRIELISDTIDDTFEEQLLSCLQE